MKPHPVGVSHHNYLLRLGRRRAEELEPRLARILQPILEEAGARAAAAFEARATNHLTAALPLVASADIGPRSAMVALYPRPEEAAALAEPGGEDPAEMHVTLAYLGEIDEHTAARVAEALNRVAATHAPLEGHVGGVAAFDDQGNGVPAILLPDVPGLVELRQDACQAILAAQADYARNHGYQPHLTVAYREAPADHTPAREGLGSPLHFDNLHLVVGNEAYATHPLTGARALTAAGELPAWSAPAPDELIDVPALVQTIKAKTEPVRLAVVKTMMTPALEGAGLSFDVTNPLTAKVLAQSASQVTNIAETTRLNVMRTIRHSYDAGLSIPHTAEAIRAGMQEASVARSTLIARTELVGAVNGGSLAATRIVADVTETTYFKQWLTAPGAQFPRHEEYDGLEGQTVRMDDYFDVGGDQLEYPGDPAGSPEEVCNCRCTMAYTDNPADLTDGSGGGVDAGDGEAAPAGEGSVSTDEALTYYHSPKAFDLNAALRSGVKLTAEQDAVVKALDSAFEPAPRDLVLWRGSPDAPAVYGKDADALSHGLTRDVSTPGYLSASEVKDDAMQFASGISGPSDKPVLERIEVPAGTPILRVPAGEYGDQHEILLPRQVGREFHGATSTHDLFGNEGDRLPVWRSRVTDPGVLGREGQTGALARSADPYVASLQAELASLDNKIANVQWYIKNGKELPHHADRLRALEQQKKELREWLRHGQDALASGSAEAKTAVLRQELKIVNERLQGAADYLRASPKDPYLKEKVKLLADRQAKLQELLSGKIAEAEAVVPAVKEAAVATGRLADDLAAIRARAEWITDREARDKALAGGRSAEGRYMNAQGVVAPYLREQMDATLAAGARLEQEIKLPAAVEERAVTAQRAMNAARAELDNATAPLIKGIEAARAKMGELNAALREEYSLKMYGMPWDQAEAGITYEERQKFLAAWTSDPRYQKAKAEIQALEVHKNNVYNRSYEGLARAKKEVQAAADAKITETRRRLFAALSEVRPMGPSSHFNIQLEGRARGYKAGKLLTDAQRFFPTDWIHRWRPIQPGTAARGHHRSGYGGVEIKVSDSTRSISTDDPGFSTAVHELGHEVEEVVPMIRELERAFYEWRTRGGTFDQAQEGLFKLSQLQPGYGYGREEVARPDKFSEVYMGKDYGGRNYELLTMGLEAVWNGSYEIDAEYRRWVLGLLALV